MFAAKHSQKYPPGSHGLQTVGGMACVQDALHRGLLRPCQSGILTYVKIIAQLKLQPTPEQADALKRTLETANAAANTASAVAWHQQTFRAYDLQKLCYGELRAQFGLSAQVVIRVLAKVGDSYRLDRNRPTFVLQARLDCLRRPDFVVGHRPPACVDLDRGWSSDPSVCRRRPPDRAACYPQGRNRPGLSAWTVLSPGGLRGGRADAAGS